MANELQNALKFLQALPKDIPIPAIVWTDDFSRVEFSWRLGPYHTFVTFWEDEDDDNGEVLGYALLKGEGRGRAYEAGEYSVKDPRIIPEDLVKYIRDALECYDYR